MCGIIQDLCERHEKGVLHEHQRALQKYGVMKRQMLSATVQPKEQVSVEQLESRIVQVSPCTHTHTHTHTHTQTATADCQAELPEAKSGDQ